jgi:hypothetical protein
VPGVRIPVGAPFFSQIVVDVVQLVERQIVVLVVGGSSPFIHPIFRGMAKWLRHQTLTLEFAGSTPATPAINQIDPLAQLAEHLTFNQGVRGSNPRWITIFSKLQSPRRFFYFLQMHANSLKYTVKK